MLKTAIRAMLAVALCLAMPAYAVNAPAYSDSSGQKQAAQGVILVNPDGTFSNGSTGVVTATIASSASLSGAVDLSSGRLSAIFIPSGWTTANITLQVSYDGTNFSNLYDAFGNEYTLIVGGASRAVLVPNLGDMLGIRYIKIRSGTSGSPVTQASSMALSLALVP